MTKAAQSLEAGGANCVLICANTLHKIADEVQASVHIPLLHIIDTAAETIKAERLQKVGLLGTRYTMEEDFYTGRLVGKHGLEVVIPNAQDRILIHNIIFEELVIGKINPASKAEYLRIMGALQSAGAEGIILGCTEIGMLVKAADIQMPLFDTARIHALAAVKFALES
jgi:aspartate racemase